MDKLEKETEILTDFIYQVEMMRRCFYRCMESNFHLQNQNKVDEDLMVAFLVHIRVFYLFFRNKGNKAEARAKHYIKSWKDVNLIKDMKPWYEQINSYLTHLDYKRVEERKGYRPYQILNLYVYFRRLIIEFINKLPKKFEAPELTKLLGELKREINNPY